LLSSWITQTIPKIQNHLHSLPNNNNHHTRLHSPHHNSSNGTMPQQQQQLLLHSMQLPPKDMGQQHPYRNK
jgi:hypothetical protein